MTKVSAPLFLKSHVHFRDAKFIFGMSSIFSKCQVYFRNATFWTRTPFASRSFGPIISALCLSRLKHEDAKSGKSFWATWSFRVLVKKIVEEELR